MIKRLLFNKEKNSLNYCREKIINNKERFYYIIDFLDNAKEVRI